MKEITTKEGVRVIVGHYYLFYSLKPDIAGEIWKVTAISDDGTIVSVSRPYDSSTRWTQWAIREVRYEEANRRPFLG